MVVVVVVVVVKQNRSNSMEIDNKNCKVCVAGGEGLVGSWLVKKLLDKGFTVHATLRNLEDKSHVELLKSFPNADTRLVLFEAELYNPDTFENPIHGCRFVFHVATPFQHTEGYQFNNIIEASVGAAKSIADFCVRSGTVRRLIYTSSIACTSALKEDGTGYKDLIDETCWTPLDHPSACSNDFLRMYAESKMLAEKEVLGYGSDGRNGNGGLEVVAIELGLVAGDTGLPYSRIPHSIGLCFSHLTNDPMLRDAEELAGKVAIAHIDDVCESHIFCMEKSSINGRFFCASAFVSAADIALYYQQNYPEMFHYKKEDLEGPKREIKWGGTKLVEQGFEYKYDLKMILEDSLKCARRTNYLPL